MTDVKEIQKRARRRRATLTKQRRDPRFQRVLGRMVAAGLLTTTEDIALYRAPIDVGDALWAGRIEPRILEVLPAAIVKRPALFTDVRKLPDDLAAVVDALRKNHEPDAFRGIAGSTLHRWLPSVGRRNKLPSRLKSFRLQVRDLELLEELSRTMGLTQTEVLRRGLRQLAASSRRSLQSGK